MKGSTMEHETCLEASLCISWTLAKHMKPYSDADTVKESRWMCIIYTNKITFFSVCVCVRNG